MFFNKEMETMPRKKIEELQLERLKYTVNYVYDKVPFYKKKFDSVGLKPSHIQTLKDIKLIPFTTKDDLRDNYPYGLYAAPMKDIVEMHASSGTTGKPITAGYTRHDLEMWSEAVARLIVAVGGNSDDIVQISFGFGLFTGAQGLLYGWQKVGAMVIPISSGNTERQIMFLRDMKPTALVSTPSYAMYLAETLKNKGLTKDDISLRLGLFGSEASTKEMHKALSEILGIFSTDNYGLTELCGPGISGDCTELSGMHINEDFFYPEVLDIEQNKDKGEGEYGELVLTSLFREGMPILRYRTKDISRLFYEPCKCGRTFARMDKIKGRTDDMLKIRGVNVFPSQIESVLVDMSEVGNHYEIVVTRDGYMDQLEVRVEVVDETLLHEYGRLEALREKVRQQIKNVLQIDVRVKLVEPFSLKRYEGKTKRVIDMRNATEENK